VILVTYPIFDDGHRHHIDDGIVIDDDVGVDGDDTMFQSS